ncbi:hypothetical protein Vafri_7339, partial [Volvox africanus]
MKRRLSVRLILTIILSTKHAATIVKPPLRHAAVERYRHPAICTIAVHLPSQATQPPHPSCPILLLLLLLLLISIVVVILLIFVTHADIVLRFESTVVCILSIPSRALAPPAGLTAAAAAVVTAAAGVGACAGGITHLCDRSHFILFRIIHHPPIHVVLIFLLIQQLEVITLVITAKKTRHTYNVIFATSRRKP